MGKIKERAIVFEPLLKEVIWGGEKIRKMKGLEAGEDKIGESWEISQMPGWETVVAHGEYKGFGLGELIEKYGEELLGKKVLEKYGKKFPLLVKFIDAKDNLSLQVHPDDELAQRRHGSNGKTEMWYIMEAEEGAKIYAGLKKEVSPDEFRERIGNNTFPEVVREYESGEGEVYFLAAGTVHAIGRGNLLTEIQESSDITYRIYDYNRRDKDGNLRELHIDLAEGAMNYKEGEGIRVEYSEANGEEELVKCEHFTTHRIKIEGEKRFEGSGDSFTIFVCVAGEVEIIGRDGSEKIKRGESALMPGVARAYSLNGRGILLRTTAG